MVGDSLEIGRDWAGVAPRARPHCPKIAGKTELQKGEDAVTKRKEPMSVEQFRRRCDEIDKMPEGTRGGALAELVAEDMSNMNPEEQKEFLKEFLERLNPQDRRSLLTALGMGPVN